MKILLVTNTLDKTSDYIEEKVNNIFRFNTDKLVQYYELSFSYKSWYLKNIITGDKVSNDTIIGGYYRRPSLPEIETDSLGEEIKKSISIESYNIYQTFLESIKCKWLVNPNIVRYTENRVIQLQYAKAVGFKIPNYLFTSNKNSAVDFINTYRKVCMKPINMKPFKYKNSMYSFYNTVIETNDVNQLEGLPIQLQKYIEKKAEYRIIILGKEIFPVLIRYSKESENSIDWRIGNCMKVDYEKTFIEDRLRILCMKLMKKLKIKFACMDIICDFNDRYYFLDLNPNGQWVWLEELLNLGIVDSLERFFYE